MGSTSRSTGGSATSASIANCSPACSRRNASPGLSVTTIARAGRTARSTTARRRIFTPNFWAKLPTPVKPAKPGLPSVGSVLLFPGPTTPSGVTNNPLGLSSQVVQEREFGQLLLQKKGPAFAGPCEVSDCFGFSCRTGVGVRTQRPTQTRVARWCCERRELGCWTNEPCNQP